MTTEGVTAASVAAAAAAKVSGDVMQVVTTLNTAMTTGTTLIPGDDTIPQITEGTEIMTATITPTSASNYLDIQAIVNVGNGGTSTDLIVAAIFQDATANALACGVNYFAANVAGQVVVRHRMTAGTTSATTFRVRVGGNNANTFTFNGSVGARLYGGVLVSSLTVTEIKA